jgi:alpha-D-xyloside xylohydrolase
MGTATDGGCNVDAPAPLDRIPLFIRAGSIVPMGPEQEWSTQKPPDPMELRVYRGANADFTLYEDENDNYNYENGVYATIPFHWDDTSQTLTIGNRKGQFPGMIENRTFHVLFVRKNHGVGVDATDEPDKVVRYSGKEITVKP